MKIYIDREDAIDAAKEYMRGMTSIDLISAIERIEDIPLADVIEVVRCKNCQYWNGIDEFGDGSCSNPDGIDNISKEDDFCSYGKRI